MTWLLRLYPRDWRRRYGAEIEEVVASHPKSLQLFIDLLGGAVDAHLKPQAFARRLDGQTADRRGGTDMVNRLRGCGGVAAKTTTRDGLVAGSVTIGSALVVAAIMMIGDSELTETIGLTMFPGVLAVGTQWVYLRGHSRLAKIALIVGMFVVLFVIGLLAGLAVSD